MSYSIIATVLVIASILLVTFNKIKSKWYAWVIYFAGLFTAYSTTMVGMTVVGSDISRELLMSNLAIQNGWDLSLYDPSNTSWVVGWFVPVLSQISHVGAEWIYKIVLPMVFAFTPVILYFIFRKQIGDFKAFYASMFFIIVPVYALEICTIGKSMVAETLMALTFWVMFNAEWKQIYKFLIMVVLVILTLWAHYTIGILLCIYLMGIAILYTTCKKSDSMMWWIFDRELWLLLGIVVIGAMSFALYYQNVAQGLIWNSSTGIFNHDFSSSFQAIQMSVTNSYPLGDNVSYTAKAYGLVKSALGLDLLQYGWSGIAFRIIQLITQILIVVGFGWMIWKRKEYNFKPEYLAGCFVAFGLLGLCIILPAFASLINATRQYHLALFFLAPCFVLAFDAIGRMIKWGIK